MVTWSAVASHSTFVDVAAAGAVLKVRSAGLSAALSGCEDSDEEQHPEDCCDEHKGRPGHDQGAQGKPSAAFSGTPDLSECDVTADDTGNEADSGDKAERGAHGGCYREDVGLGPGAGWCF